MSACPRGGSNHCEQLHERNCPNGMDGGAAYFTDGIDERQFKMESVRNNIASRHNGATHHHSMTMGMPLAKHAVTQYCEWKPEYTQLPQNTQAH